MVHPHACGENFSGGARIRPPKGSPPRLWGKQSLRVSPLPTHRFTPTPVGKTLQPRAPWSISLVHPHACGENINSLCRLLAHKGSPPRLWGKRVGRGVGYRWRWFTPTPVGKTRPRCRLTRPWPVHPHACGENVRRIVDRLGDSGSPPRLWGKLRRASSSWSSISQVPWPATQSQRFTPTPVGKTRIATPEVDITEVHPHACGENAAGGYRVLYIGGSPPRLWGKLAMLHYPT